MFLASTISPYHSFFHRPILLIPAGFNHLFVLPVYFLPFVLNTHTNSNLFYPLFPHPFILRHIMTIFENSAICLQQSVSILCITKQNVLCKQLNNGIPYNVTFAIFSVFLS